MSAKAMVMKNPLRNPKQYDDDDDDDDVVVDDVDRCPRACLTRLVVGVWLPLLLPLLLLPPPPLLLL